MSDTVNAYMLYIGCSAQKPCFTGHHRDCIETAPIHLEAPDPLPRMQLAVCTGSRPIASMVGSRVLDRRPDPLYSGNYQEDRATQHSCV